MDMASQDFSEAFAPGGKSDANFYFFRFHGSSPNRQFGDIFNKMLQNCYFIIPQKAVIRILLGSRRLLFNAQTPFVEIVVENSAKTI